MSSSQEIKAEALSLIQGALEKSEALVKNLRAELRRKRPTKNELEKRVDVLNHRLGKSEQDRDNWKTEAEGREELIGNANAKLEQLKARLEIAESGPDKLTKKEINYWRTQAETFDKQTAEYKERIVALQRELNARGGDLSQCNDTAAEAAQAEAAQAADARTAETLKERLSEREAELREQNAQCALLQAENTRLNDEFSEERERSEAVGEMANERLDQLNKFRERYEEIEERFEESEWRRRNSKHFERLVHRRKGLISALISTIRAKSKANTALKAGLDSLRRYKATAQASEQKLLVEIERLKSRLGEARETLERHQDTTLNEKKLSESHLRIGELEDRVKTQAELIASLEEELKLAKVVQTDLNQKMVAAQNEISGRQKTIDDVAAASETDRENDRLMIDALERESAELRDKLATQSAAGAEQAGVSGELGAELKQHVEKIQKLTEEVNSWKRKYEFLATDAPDAYKTQSVAEK